MEVVENRIVALAQYRDARRDDRQSPSYGFSPASEQLEKLTQVVMEIRDDIHAICPERDIQGRSTQSEVLVGKTVSSRSDIAQMRFENLATRWRSETSFCASALEMATNQYYQNIIGMGEMAVPFILRELAKQPEHWFWALKAITGEDPVPEEDRGDIPRMTEAWLLWGVRNGYDI